MSPAFAPGCLRRCAASALLGFLVTGAVSAPDTSATDPLQRASVDALKAVYLECNRETLAGHLDRGALMGCSMVYEALKRKAFGGDFLELLAWSRAQDAAPVEMPPPAAQRR